MNLNQSWLLQQARNAELLARFGTGGLAKGDPLEHL